MGRWIADELLDKMQCPRCGGELVEDEQPRLRCRACRWAYAVEDGIPNMIVDEAIPPEDGAEETTDA